MEVRNRMTGNLSAWERVEIARNSNRKTALDYIEKIFDELHSISIVDDGNFIFNPENIDNLNEILEKKDKQVRDEIKTLSSTELVDLEKQFKEELFNLRFQLATGQLENTARLNKVRKNIARIKTALRQAELNK